MFHAPAWSADGQKVFYAVVRSDGKVAVRRVDVATGAEDEFTGVRFEAPVLALAVAPSGSQVALAVLRKGRLELHLMATAGDSQIVWSTPAGTASCEMAWTPDGRALVVAITAERSAVLWHVPASGKGPRKLFDGAGSVRAPVVSPRVDRVAFLARLRADAPWSLYVTTLTGGTTMLASALCFGAQPGYEPAWSPDGRELAYVAERHLTPGYAEVRAVALGSAEQRLIARSATGACLAPAWSPDGATIACMRLPFRARKGSDWRGRPADIALFPASGGMPQPAVSDAMLNTMPAWSPDGAAIAFNTAVGPAARPHAVRLLNVRTGHVRPLRKLAFDRFLVAHARASRGDTQAARQAEAEAPRIASPQDRAYAHDLLAWRAAEQRQWAAAARHAACAAEGAAPSPTALRLLVTCLLHAGQADAALAAAQRLAALTEAKEDLTRRNTIRRAVADVRRLRAADNTKDDPAALLQLARASILDLANAKQGLPLCLRLLRAFPATAEATRAAPLLFRCREALGTLSVSYTDLEAAAALTGDAAITPAQALALAEGAAAASRADTALAWLDRAGGDGADGAWKRALAAGCLRVGRQLRAVGAMGAALEALDRGSRLGLSAPSAQASLEAARLLWEMGRHAEVPDTLLRAFIDEADTDTLRGAARLMTAGRLSRRERASYDVARVGELVRFGFHASATTLGEQFLTDPQAPPARIRRVKQHLAGAYDGLVAYHLGREDLPTARATVTRWLRIAEPQRDLGRALECLATCQELAGQGQEALATLSRIVAECPGSPQAAAARQRLLEERLP